MVLFIQNIFFLLFQHLFEFLNHIREYNYLMFDLFEAKIMMNEEDVQLKEMEQILKTLIE
jgi:hypothetical protein